MRARKSVGIALIFLLFFPNRFKTALLLAQIYREFGPVSAPLKYLLLVHLLGVSCLSEPGSM